MMALGQHLGAHQQAGLPFPRLFQKLVQAAPGAGCIPVDAHQGMTGKLLLQYLLQLFRALPQRMQLGRAAGGAMIRQRAFVAAMMADEFPLTIVHGLAGVAAWTVRQPAAAVAGEYRGIAAPVEKHHGLLPLGKGLFQRLQQGGREAALQPLVADVQQLHAGLAGLACAAGQPEPGVAIFHGILQAFQGRGGRAQHHGAAGTPGAHQRHVPGGVTEAFLLLVGAVVLLVHQHQAEIRQGREDR